MGLPIPSDSPEPELAVVQQACFAAGTFILMAAGLVKLIEDIRIGDEVLCKDDGDPLGPLRARVVDKLHKHSPTALLNLHIGDLLIRSTANHPFWEQRQRRWTPAAKLQAGDLVLGHDGRLHEVTEVFDNGDVEPVFNLAVAECHTYFVCDKAGEIAALVHNEYSGVIRQPIYNDDGSVTLVYDIYMLEPSLLALTELRHHVKRVQITVNPADANELKELQDKYNQLMDSKIGTMNDAQNWNDFGDALNQSKDNAIMVEVGLAAELGGHAIAAGVKYATAGAEAGATAAEAAAAEAAAEKAARSR